MHLFLYGNSLFSNVDGFLAALRPADTVDIHVLPGSPTQSFIDNFEAHVHPSFVAGELNVVVLLELLDHINDFGGTAATAHAKYAEFVALAQSFGWHVMVITCPDTGEFDADSPHPTRGDLQPEREGANNLIRADFAGADYLCDAEADPMFSMELDAASNTTNYESDEIHFKAPAQEHLAELIDGVLLASPAYRSDSSTFVSGGGPTSLTVTEPTGAASGDGLLLLFLADHTGTGTGPVNTPSGGWTLWNPGGTAILAGDFDVWVWTLRRGGSAPSYQVTWTNPLDGFGYAELHAVASSGVVGTGEIVDAFAVGSPGTGTVVNPPAVTLVTADTLVYACGFNWAGWGSAPTESGYTVVIGGGALDTAVGYRQVAATGSEDPAAFSAADGSGDFVALTIAFRSVEPSAAAPNALFFGAFP